LVGVRTGQRLKIKQWSKAISSGRFVSSRTAFQVHLKMVCVPILPGVTCYKPVGAFYVFPNFSSHYGKSYQGKKIENSTALADYFLDVAKVAVVPGVEFGADPFERLSYATSMEDIKQGLNRIEEALKKLS